MRPEDLPLAGCRVLERSTTVAAAYAGRLLAAMGAEVLMLEPPGGSPLRQAAPRLEGSGESALFAYLAAGKRSRVCDPATPAGQAVLQDALAGADILFDDTPVDQRAALGLDEATLSARHPRLVHVSVRPFGAHGPKAGWDGEEVNLLHAGGEGFLLPNGLSHELFPDRPPLKIYGHFGSYQGGAMAAFSALSAWWAAGRLAEPGEAGERGAATGQGVDVSVQDAVLAVGAFALQRLGDGSLEHRATRRFRYGGVFEAQDGFIELLTLEDRQWQALVALLDHPAWAADPALADPLERSRRGDEINQQVRGWMRRHRVEDIVQRAQALGVPAARYRTPAEVLHGDHERARGLFAPLALADGSAAEVLLAPFQFRSSPLNDGATVQRVPRLGSANAVEARA